VTALRCTHSLIADLMSPVQETALPEPCPVAAPSGQFDGKTTDAISYKLAVARELYCRLMACKMENQPIFSDPSTVRDWLRMYCADLEHDVLLVLFLDARNRLIVAEEMFRGAIDTISVHPREIVKAALARNARTILMAHNHPTQVTEPSLSDEFITRDVRDALALVDIKLLDHMIVGGTEITSLAERGMI